MEEIQKEKIDQKGLPPLIKETIRINQEYIWADALEEYNLPD